MADWSDGALSLHHVDFRFSWMTEQKPDLFTLTVKFSVSCHLYESKNIGREVSMHICDGWFGLLVLGD